jgi:hypothetical protein
MRQVVSVLKLRGGSRRAYLRLCEILIEMAEAFFSSSWRILEPHGCAQIGSRNRAVPLRTRCRRLFRASDNSRIRLG